MLKTCMTTLKIVSYNKYHLFYLFHWLNIFISEIPDKKFIYANRINTSCLPAEGFHLTNLQLGVNWEFILNTFQTTYTLVSTSLFQSI